MIKIITKTVSKVKHKLYERKTKNLRSKKWPALERKFSKIHPTCSACGGTDQLQVHHIIPFHLKPELELEMSNLIMLCMGELDCHLRLGHGGSFSCYNPNIVVDAAEFLKNIEARTALVKTAKLNRKKSV
jgi:5-methylcytosine-specific restriction protein A